MTSTLYRGGVVYSPADPRATAVLVSDGVIVWLGPDGEAPAADRAVDLDGALVTPAFVDAHVHATDTGLTLSGLDLSHTRSAGELLDAVAAFAGLLPSGTVLLGHGWDETTWSEQTPPDAATLSRAAGGRITYLSQASIHSALCSTELLAAAPSAAGEPGYDPSGWVRRQSHHAVRAVALGSITPAQRRRAQRTTLARAASLGIAAVHECGGPGTSEESDFTGLLAMGGAANRHPEVYGYWGELMGAAKARDLGAVGAGGDLYADGALGSRTAHLSSPYLDLSSPAGSERSDLSPNGGAGEGSDGGACGHGYVTADQVRDHVLDCAEQNMQGGFHAIGDAAIATVLDGFATAAERLGTDRLRAARHRVEHAEIMDKRLIAGFVNYGIVASMQPAFDRLWGGDAQMYAQRLGVARSLGSNPMGAMHGVGVALAFGSDSPVTALDPWGTVRAAMWHFNPVHRMSAQAAFAAHTRGGWRAVHRDGEGALLPGLPATFAVWQTPAGISRGLPNLLAEDRDARGPADPTPLPRCVMTVLRGVRIHGPED